MFEFNKTLEINNNKTLKLTLKAEPFEVMISGEKIAEYRKPSAWIMSRLYNKDGSEKEYDFVKFTNGYNSDSPSFLAIYCGFEIVEQNQIITYSNGLVVNVEKGDIMICFLITPIQNFTHKKIKFGQNNGTRIENTMD